MIQKIKSPTQDQTLAGVSHYLSDLLTVHRLIAVDFTVLARRFGVLRTTFQPFEGVVQQTTAIVAQLAPGRFVLTAAVDMHKLPQDIAVLSRIRRRRIRVILLKLFQSLCPFVHVTPLFLIVQEFIESNHGGKEIMDTRLKA